MKIVLFSLLIIMLMCSFHPQPKTSGSEVLTTTQPLPSPSPMATMTPLSSPSPRTQMFSPATTVEELQDELKRLDSFEKHGGFQVKLVSPKILEFTFEPDNQAAESELHGIDLGILSLPDDVIVQIIIAIFSNEKKIGELEGVKVRQIGATPKYEVVENYTYESKKNNYKITAHKGFIYDRASIPPIFWGIIDKDSLSNVAPLFHDLLYGHGGKLPENQVVPYRTFTREEADNLFYELMTKCGVTTLRRNLAYTAVRGLAGSHWRDK